MVHTSLWGKKSLKNFHTVDVNSTILLHQPLYICPSKHLGGVVRQAARTLPSMKPKQRMLLVLIQVLHAISHRQGKLVDGP